MTIHNQANIHTDSYTSTRRLTHILKHVYTVLSTVLGSVLTTVPTGHYPRALWGPPDLSGEALALQATEDVLGGLCWDRIMLRGAVCR